MKTIKISIMMASVSLCLLGVLVTGCTDAGGTSGAKPGAGGFSKDEKARMQSGPTEDDKKRMQEYMKQHSGSNQPAANTPVNSK